jgi:translation elongation factor EF-Tu-like GTPase
MPTRKKAKGKTKAKRKKTPVVKATTRRKATTARKKPAKKTPVRRASPKKAIADRERAVKQRPAQPATPTQPAPPGERIGVVTHYYSHLSVATLRLESGTLRVGDRIHIRGHTTDFSQNVESLEVNHAPATEVGPNDDFGLKVIGHVREHDVVYKVQPSRH